MTLSFSVRATKKLRKSYPILIFNLTLMPIIIYAIFHHQWENGARSGQRWDKMGQIEVGDGILKEVETH